MKSIKNYLNESIENEDYLNESVLDMEGDKAEILKWIRDNYTITGRLSITKDFVVNCTGNVFIKNESITSLTNGMFKWGKINKNFTCGWSKELRTLKGAPEYVGVSFGCVLCKNLETLEGAPKYVGLDFNCSLCDNLTNLEGAPKEVGRHFECSRCKNLKSLAGAPKKIGGSLDCHGCDKLSITDDDRKKYNIESFEVELSN